MQNEFFPLLKLLLKHDYFPEGNCPAVEVVPTQTTQSVMQQLGIRMVNRDYGVEYFYNDSQAVPVGTELTFLLRVNDPLFANYTDLIQTQHTLPLILTDTPLSADIGTVTFTVSESIPAEASVTFTSRATTWRYHFIDPQGTFSGYELKDAQTKAVIAAAGAAPELRELANSTQALVLATPHPIPLRKRPAPTFELSVQAKATAAPTTIPLPAADANRIISDDTDKTVFYSDVYVYL